MPLDFNQLPKIELHLHLDCSLSFEVVQQLSPTTSYDEYRASFVAPPKCTDLADYISRAIKGFELMQTPHQLRLVTLDLFKQLKADHVIYAEIRFAPLQHTYQGLSASEVVRIVNEAVEEGIAQTGIKAGIILCTLRHYNEAQSMETIQLVEQFRGSCVVGFDIAADEAGFPITAHIKAFEYAKAQQIPCTAHAGEAKGAQSVWETLEHFCPSRIGHGVRSIEDPQLLAFLKKQAIHLEVCPTSNVQTNVVESIKQHPANQLFEAGISMSINTDARTISDVTLTSEYQLLQQVFHWQKAHFLHCNLEAITHAFASDATKETLRQRLIEGFRQE
ncbi:MAG: adenosine deaminase [Spirosomataceae bacterium]